MTPTDKRLTSIHVSKLTDRQIDELKDALGLKQSEIITMAIDRLYQQEIAKEAQSD